jgi:hypothetical protein
VSSRGIAVAGEEWLFLIGLFTWSNLTRVEPQEMKTDEGWVSGDSGTHIIPPALPQQIELCQIDRFSA